MIQPNDDRRKYSRFEMGAKIYFQVIYPFETRIEYKILENKQNPSSQEKHSALSKNISVEGLCFTSRHKLEAGNKILLDVYLPDQSEPLQMVGEARWSKMNSAGIKQGTTFDTGIKLLSVKEQSVTESVYFDQENRIIWSVVLESVFGGFRKFSQRIKSL